MKQLFSLLLIVLCCVGCGRRAQVATDQPLSVFLPTLPPSHMKGDTLIDYMAAHYWDRFDFGDTLFLSRADTLEMIKAYAGYISQYMRPTNPAPMDSLMRKASASRAMLVYFQMLGERVLNDPNSPLRSNELYIPVLRAVVESPHFDQWERIAPEHDLHLAMQNRVGHAANDFTYTLASGAGHRLYSIRSNYTLIFFSDPECPMCRDLRAQINASQLLSGMIERGELSVLVLYTGSEMDKWRNHQSEISKLWINGYDKGQVIEQTELYDTRATPSFYLLDRQKRVLIKDSAAVPELEQAIDGNQGV